MQVQARIHPALLSRVQEIDPLGLDGLERTFSRVPEAFANRLFKRYAEVRQQCGRDAAKKFAIENIHDLFPLNGASYIATDSELRDQAERVRAMAHERLTGTMPEDERRATLERVAEKFGVTLPKARDAKAWSKLFARAQHTRWWLRQLRGRERVIEHAAIRCGFVNARTAPYVSDMAFTRFEQKQRQALRFLDAMQLECLETGQIIPLDQVAASNVSSPKNRFTEQMVRLKGMEADAALKGFVALFVTWTVPSRMHASGISGERNPKYDGTRSDAANKYLNKLFARVRAQWKRDAIECFGHRVSEPHKDGTPHRHFVIFVMAEQEESMLATMRAHALTDDADEAGAQEHRFRVERCDPAKGSAAGYMVKYIAKNIDGKAVGHDMELPGIDSKRSAPRVTAWSRIWRIRQFQSFGTPTVTVWRELRRHAGQHDAPPADAGEPIGVAWRAAHAGDWCAFMQAQSTPETRLRPLVEMVNSQTYPGEQVARVYGVVAPDGSRLITKEMHYVMRLRPEVRACRLLARRAVDLPWTRGNNCTRAEESERQRTRNVAHSLEPWPDFPQPVQLDAGGLMILQSARIKEQIFLNSPGYPIGSFARTSSSVDEDRARYAVAKAESVKAFFELNKADGWT